ncbi:MAG: hypothetical protein DMF16_08960 [Verrucomicrobia bacterium]|nr:MAG: hypothetical protein DMF16_08960 [Verrucomicrobiota bacterium]
MLPCSQGSGCLSSQALSEANRNQDPASCQESYPRIRLIGGKPMDHNASTGIAAANVIERQEQGGEFKEP